MAYELDSLLNWLTTPRQEHVVAYYSSDDVLVESLYTYVSEGVKAGDYSLVITSPRVMKSLHKILRANNVSDTGYTILNSESVLEDFMINGNPNKIKFFKKVNQVITENSRPNQPLRIYGDMVAFLVENQNAKAAIKLEKLWNELAKTQKFALYCAYPKHLFLHNDEVMSDINAHHSLNASFSIKNTRIENNLNDAVAGLVRA